MKKRDKAEVAASTPEARARKRRESEIETAREDAAYKEMYGDPNKETGLDQFLKIADQLRGTIGGLAGAVVGATLDVVSAFRKAQVETTKSNAQPSATAMVGAAATAEVAGSAEAAGGAVAAAVPLVGVIIAAVAAFKLLIQSIDETSRKYSQYSPELAGAQAYAEITRTLGDFRRAQEVGPELSTYTRIQADLQNEYENVKIKLMMQILPMIEVIMKGTGSLLTLLNNLLPGINQSAQETEENTGVVAAVNRWLQEWLNNNQNNVMSPTEVLLRGQVR